MPPGRLRPQSVSETLEKGMLASQRFHLGGGENHFHLGVRIASFHFHGC